MQRKHDPRQSLPRPSKYAAARMQPQIGDVCVYSGQAYLVASILDMAQPLYAGEQVGIHYVLRRANWQRWVFLIVPAALIEQPQDFAA
jgi:hypothetical protein